MSLLLDMPPNLGTPPEDQPAQKSERAKFSGDNSEVLIVHCVRQYPRKRRDFRNCSTTQENNGLLFTPHQITHGLSDLVSDQSINSNAGDHANLATGFR
jgi:hypothetical protein